jgi:hypothetical protein
MIFMRTARMRCFRYSIAASCMLFFAQAIACDPKHPEEFPEFFASFLEDKSFAVSRTIYPSAVVRYEYRIEDGKQQITESRKKMNRDEDMRYPGLGEYMKSIGLEHRPQELSANEAVVEISKSGNSGLLTYHFSLNRGCWFLREIQNHSL